MLHELIEVHRAEIIRRCGVKIAIRSVAPPIDEDIDHDVSAFLDQLVEASRLGLSSSAKIRDSAARHGHHLLSLGFTVSEVAHYYGDVCQSLTQLAVEARTPISADDFHWLDECFDDAIADAVTQCGREGNQSAIDGEAARLSQRFGFFTHELRNLISTAIFAFEVLKSGRVGVAGSTGAALQRSLTGVRDLVDRSIAEVTLTQGVQNSEQFLVSNFIDELAPAAMLVAEAGAITFTVIPVEPGVMIAADRQILAAVVMNLLQNAFKFTRPRTTVTLRVGVSADRVLLEIGDECGGLKDEDIDELFRPFQQRGANRTGLGLGLAFSKWGAEANQGRVYARSIPGVGCVFTVDLPRVPLSALAIA